MKRSRIYTLTVKSWTDLALEVAIVWSVLREEKKEVVEVEGSGLKEAWRRGGKRVGLEKNWREE